MTEESKALIDYISDGFSMLTLTRILRDIAGDEGISDEDFNIFVMALAKSKED